MVGINTSENTADAPEDRDLRFMLDSIAILRSLEKSSNKSNMKMMQMPDIKKYQQINTKLNERQTLIKEFLDRLNAERDPAKFKPLSAGRVAMMLSPIKTKDLYAFLGSCKDSTHFSKFFWSRFKKPPVTVTRH